MGNPGPASCGGIYRDKDGVFMGAFAYNLGTSNFCLHNGMVQCMLLNWPGKKAGTGYGLKLIHLWLP